MERYYIVMKWTYNYDKEGTWFDTDEGEYAYELLANTNFKVPHISNRYVDILEVSQQGEQIAVTLQAEYETFTIRNDGETVTKHASGSYMVAGDSVHQSVSMTFSLRLKEEFHR